MADRTESGTPPVNSQHAADAFISYASQDKDVADAVCHALERAGVPCWIAPRNVFPGESYAGAIVHAIDDTKLVVLVLSQHGASSPHVLREVERASSKRHPVVTLRIAATPMPADLEYFLNLSQWLDASDEGVDSALPRLVDAVRHIIASPGNAGVAHGPAASLSQQTSSRGSVSRRRRYLVPILGVVILMGLAYVVVNAVRLGTPSATNQPTPAVASAVSEQSIAVLPFVDMSEKHDQEYFSDGLSEELIDHLAHNPGLKVVARTSSFAFKGKNEDMTAIAAKLRVANLLEGSVRKAGGALRITVQLIRASDGLHLWSKIYDRRTDDIFRVQDEISTTVAKALNVALNATPSAGGNPAAKGTTNIAAYNQLLQGNYFFWRGNLGDNAKAVGHLLQALNLDPRYVPAWAKLARIYAYQVFSGELAAEEGAARGRAAVDRALALDPDCAEAYYARAQISRLIDGDWNASMADNEKAAALDPRGEVGANARANNLMDRTQLSGRFDDAIAFARHRLERDPLDTETMSDLAFFEQSAGRLDESSVTSRRLLELNPDYVAANAQYAVTLLLMGKNPESLAMAEKESDDASRYWALACVYWAMGRHGEADSALAALERGFSDRKAYEIASIHAWRGEAELAFAWLDRAYRQRKGSLGPLKTDPLLRRLRDNPRFDALLRKAKLSE